MLFSIFMFLFIVWVTFKVVPAILGFTFSVLLALLQVVAIIFLLPILGALCLVVDAVLVFAIIGLVKLMV
jgi:hypothetical protein